MPHERRFLRSFSSASRFHLGNLEPGRLKLSPINDITRHSQRLGAAAASQDRVSPAQNASVLPSIGFRVPPTQFHSREWSALRLETRRHFVLFFGFVRDFLLRLWLLFSSTSLRIPAEQARNHGSQTKSPQQPAPRHDKKDQRRNTHENKQLYCKILPITLSYLTCTSGPLVKKKYKRRGNIQTTPRPPITPPHTSPKPLSMVDYANRNGTARAHNGLRFSANNLIQPQKPLIDHASTGNRGRQRDRVQQSLISPLTTTYRGKKTLLSDPTRTTKVPSDALPPPLAVGSSEKNDRPTAVTFESFASALIFPSDDLHPRERPNMVERTTNPFNLTAERTRKTLKKVSGKAPSPPPLVLSMRSNPIQLDPTRSDQTRSQPPPSPPPSRTTSAYTPHIVAIKKGPTCQTTHGAFFFSVRGSYAAFTDAVTLALAAPPFNDALHPFSNRKNVKLAIRIPSVMSTWRKR